MTCICGHSIHDHQRVECAYQPPTIEDCDLCDDCPWFTDATTPPMFGGDDD